MKIQELSNKLEPWVDLGMNIGAAIFVTACGIFVLFCALVGFTALWQRVF